jgi:hypothetical protein
MLADLAGFSLFGCPVRFSAEPTRRFSGEATAVFSLKRLMHSQKGEREKSRAFLTFRAALGDPLRIFPNGRA